MTRKGKIRDREALACVGHFVACASQYTYAAERGITPLIDRDVRAVAIAKAWVCWVLAVEGLARLASAPRA